MLSIIVEKQKKRNPQASLFLYMIFDNYRTIIEDFLKVVAVIDYII